MVTVAQARSQIATQREALQSQEQQIKQISIPILTAAQVRQQTQQSIAQRQTQSQQLEGRKVEALQSLKPFEQELSRFESQVKSVETQIKRQKEEQAAFRKALDVFRDPDPRAVFGLSGIEEKFFKQISAGKTTSIRLQQEKATKELKEKGFEPIFVNGEIKGLKDLIQQQTIELKLVPKQLFTPLPKADIIIPQISQKEFKGIIEKGGEKIRELGKKATSGLETGREATLKTIFPFFRKETNLVNSENRRLQNEFGRLNSSINNFNNKFSGELNETQLKLAENQKIKLDKSISKFLKLQNKTEEDRSKRSNERQRLFFEEAVKSAGVGAVSLVFDIPALVVGLATQPIETLGGIRKGLGGFKEQFATQPATVFGFLGGQLLIGQGVGGLVGVRGVSKIKGKAKTKIGQADLESQIIFSGTAKEKVIRNVANFDNEFKILNDQGKITSTIAYRLKTVDGRSFEVIEFSKAVGVGLEKELAGVREILAFEIKKPGQIGEVLVGRAGEKITGQKGQSFVDLIRFKVPNTIVGRLRQQITGRPAAKRFEILQKSKLETSKTIGGITKITERTKAGIVRVSNAQRSITRNALIFSRELKKGRSIESVLGRNLSKLRSLINVERRLKGKRIFNQKEFEATFSKTLSQSELLKILDDISIVGLVKETSIGVGLRLVGKRKVGLAGGADIKKLPKSFAKLKRKSTLEKTFVKEKKPIIKPKFKKLKDKFGRFREARLITKDKIKGAKAPKLKTEELIQRKPSRDLFPEPEVIRLPPTFAAPAVSLALARPLTSFGSPVRIVTRSATGVKSAFALIPSLKSLLLLRSNIKQLERLRQDLTTIPKTQQTTLTQSRILTLQKTIQLQKSKLTQLQRMKQLVRSTPPKPIAPKLIPLLKRTIIVPPSVKKLVKKKLLVSPFQPKGRGYNVLVKSKGRLMRVNIRAITKKKALDLGAFVTDQSLGATFKIVKTNRKAKVPKINFPRNYFGLTRNKYRSPIKKGKPKPIKNLLIEKRRNRLDTLRETKKIQAARLIAQLRKKALSKIKPIKFKRV